MKLTCNFLQVFNPMIEERYSVFKVAHILRITYYRIKSLELSADCKNCFIGKRRKHDFSLAEDF